MAKRNPHYLRDGLPKREFANMETAKIAADDMTIVKETLLQAYKCPNCPFYHVGRAKKIKPRPTRVDVDELIELGIRVVGCIRLENLGSPSSRTYAIKQRAKAVQQLRRQWRGVKSQPRRERKSVWAGRIP